MKLTKIILLLISALTFFACEDKNIFPHPMTQPVKATEIDVKVKNVFAMPDGRVAALVCNDRLEYDYSVSIVDRNGLLSSSDIFNIGSENGIKIRVSSSGDLYVLHNDTITFYRAIAKINNKGHVVYNRSAFDAEELYKNINTQYKGTVGSGIGVFMMLNSGEGAFLLDKPCRICVFDNEGFFKNLMYQWTNFSSDDYHDCCFPFEDKFIFNYHNYFYIINIDGSLVCNKAISSDLPIKFFNYLHGFIYMVASDGSKWIVSKIDTTGNIIYKTDPIFAYSLLENLTVHDGILMIPGVDKTGDSGAIFLIDENNAEVNEIDLNYEDVRVIPCVISSDEHDEFDVFAVVRQPYYNNENDGKLYIYHTDDLHNFNKDH